MFGSVALGVVLNIGDGKREAPSLKLYDVTGREVRTLIQAKQEPGRYRVGFETHGLSSGVYFYRLKAGSVVKERKLLLMK